MTVPTPVAVITVVMLSIALVMVLIRLAKGPTLLDRVIAVDVIMAILVCALGLYTAVSGDRSYVSILIALTLLAFIASVSVARLGPIRDHRPFEHGHSSYTGQLPKVERKRKEGH